MCSDCVRTGVMELVVTRERDPKGVDFRVAIAVFPQTLDELLLRDENILLHSQTVLAPEKTTASAAAVLLSRSHERGGIRDAMRREHDA